jgi:outer membrane autotransporter protein
MIIRRDLTLPSPQSLNANYQAGTTQLFGELSTKADLGAVDLAPFLSLAYVNLKTDQANETGGAGALSVAASSSQALFTTVGFRTSASFAVRDTMLLELKGSAAWEHAFGSAPGSLNRLPGATPFAVAGAPIAGDVALLALGLDLNASPTLSMAVAYDGALSKTAQGHRLSAEVTGKF